MTHGERTRALTLEAVFNEPIFPPVPLPLDVTNEALFPEMAAARRHLETLRTHTGKEPQ